MVTMVIFPTHPLRQGLRAREESRAKERANAKDRLEREQKESRESTSRLLKELKGKNWIWGRDGEVRACGGGGDRADPTHV